MSTWFFQPVLHSYALAAVMAVVSCLLLLVGPAYRRLSRARRVALSTLRVILIALLVLAMLRPTHISTTTKPQTAVLLMLFDASRSMQLPQASGELTRWQAQTEALRRAESGLNELTEKMEVRVYSYDAQLQETPFQDGILQLPESPEGPQTDIGSNLHASLQRELGKRLAGVVLLGDGVQTAYQPEVEIQQAGRELARLGYPLYAVAFGPTGDAVQSRDVAVENLADQYTVFVKNRLPLQATLRAYGYANKSIPVELILEHPDGHAETIGTTVVQARNDGEQVSVNLNYTPEQPGRYKLIVRAAEQPGELVVKNNELSTFVRVLEGGLKILYIEGELRNEQKFLRLSLAASADFEVDFLWIDQQASGGQAVDLSEPLSDPEYDVYILGDLDSTVLSREDQQRLVAAVDQGKGLALLGGYHSFGAGGYGQSELAPVLPIVIDRLERQDFGAPIRDDLHLPGPIHMVPTRSHAITRLAAEEQNADLWKRLPALRGANKFFDVKQSAGTAVIAESEDGAPLLVTSEYGRGRVMAFAGDSTWRWWMQGFEDQHRRFWRQAVLWLVRRDNLEQDEVFVRLERRRFNPGSRVSFRVGVQRGSGEPISDAVVRCQLNQPDGSSRELSVAANQNEWLGTIPGLQVPGDYTIDVTAEKDGKMIGSGSGEFLIYDRDIELSTPAADHDQLARLASLTEEFGGRTVAPEQLPSLLDEIRQRPPEMEIEVQTKWQFADSPKDAWAFFLAFVALISAEWFLRKRWGLV